MPSSRRLSSSKAVEGEVMALLDQLKTGRAGDGQRRLGADAGLRQRFDALSSSQFAANQIAALQDAVYNGQITTDDAIPQLLVPLVYYELSGGVVDLAKDVYDVGRGLGGPALGDDVDLAAVATSSARARMPTSPPSRATW